MNKQKIYIETSFISYLTSFTSSDLIIAAHQQITQEWWNNKRENYKLYLSQLVYEEASKGDPKAAKKRIEILSKFPILKMNHAINNLASDLVRTNIIP